MGKASAGTVIDPSEIEAHQLLASDPLAFCEIACNGFRPNPAQLKVISAALHKLKAILIGGRRQGKTYGLARKVAWDLYRLPGCKIYIYAPSETQSNILFDDVVTLYETSPYLSRYVPFKPKGDTLYVHNKPNQSRLMLLKVGPDAQKVRGHGCGKCGYIIADEILAHYDPRTVSSVIEPFILESMGNGGLLYVSSPGEAVPGDFLYDRYCDWGAQEKAALEAGREPRHRVFRITIDDVDHIDREEVADQKRQAEQEGRLWWWLREYMGEFTVSSGQYFTQAHVNKCAKPDAPIQQGDRLSVYIYAFDPGSRGSPAVLQIARYNQLLNRLEVVHVASFIFKDKYKADTGDEKITAYSDITEAVIDLRHRFPCHTCYIDPNCERSLTESWENQLQMNVVPVPVGGYSQKVTLLGDLERAMQDGRIVWSDPRITEQLLRFAPPTNKTSGHYEWDKVGRHDQIICLAMLTKYLGDRIVTPFAVKTAKRTPASQWALW